MRRAPTAHWWAFPLWWITKTVMSREKCPGSQWFQGGMTPGPPWSASVSHPTCCITAVILLVLCFAICPRYMLSNYYQDSTHVITPSKAVGSRAETNPQATRCQKTRKKRKKQSSYTGCNVSSVSDSYWRVDLRGAAGQRKQWNVSKV